MSEQVKSRRDERSAIAERTKFLIAAVCAMLALAGVAISLRERQTIGRLFGVAKTSTVGQYKTMLASKTPIETRVDAVGTLSAASQQIVEAPYEGIVKNVVVAFGDRVEEGDVLFEMDDGDLSGRLREAETELLRASMTYEALTHWEAGPEVTRARRALASAQQGLARLRQQRKDVKLLLDKGIVSKDEFDGLQQQTNGQEDALATAQQDLDETLRRGDARNLRVAELALKNAQSRMDELTAQQRMRIVRARRPGVFMHLPASEAQSRADGKSLGPGMRASKGQALAAIGDIEQFAVEAHIDEIDIGKIRIGQTFSVSGDSFPGPPIEGKITMAAVEADQDSNVQALARFGVRGVFAPDERRRRDLRIGASARMSIVTYFNPQAIVIPPDAVKEGAGEHFVEILGNDGKEVRALPVRLGVSAPAGIEITSGLAGGETVILP